MQVSRIDIDSRSQRAIQRHLPNSSIPGTTRGRASRSTPYRASVRGQSSVMISSKRSNPMKNRSWFAFGAALALTLALPVLGRADGKDGKDKDRAAKEWTVNFGQAQPQTPDAATVPPAAPSAGAAVTHFLDP